MIIGGGNSGGGGGGGGAGGFGAGARGGVSPLHLANFLSTDDTNPTTRTLVKNDNMSTGGRRPTPKKSTRRKPRRHTRNYQSHNNTRKQHSNKKSTIKHRKSYRKHNHTIKRRKNRRHH